MEKGDIIYLEFECWISDQNRLFDTTDEQFAKDEGIYNEDKTYGPLPVIVGTGRVIKGLDNSLLEADVGKEYEVEIEPKDAYGERDPKLVEIVSMHEFRRQKIEPVVGQQITIKNKQCTITGVFAGRVRVDYNHQLAGKKLRYKYKVLKKAESTEEKINAIIKLHYGRADEFKVELNDDEAEILLPDVSKYDLSWFNSKLRIVSDLRDYVNLRKVRFIEEYIKKEKVEEEKAEESKE